ncbi:hypothetical protein GCM10025867_37640 [Frondihabitans sucicola]|uniref:Glycosyltransferase RgtA/B/C/D-like domain-containing protein n=1 Tax=Frondihabitans sucicola TaxID=1268041 RepID=A0ABM8GTA0_9MICO|nr:hypothetical protein [Frondihabitans sucicola]BDZ51523.1 hypothetical protein GCM10025867_37640 [Frondihabitans sucicola]
MTTIGAWVLPVVLVLISILTQFLAARSRQSPVFSDDEIGYLANSIVMSGFGSIPHLSGQSYYPGWSVVLVPLWWVLQDPSRVYRAALIMSALAALASLPFYALIARRFGTAWPTAVSAAAIITLLPAITQMSGFALAENFLGLMVAVCGWAAVRAFQRPTPVAFVILGAASAYAFFSHGRLVGLVGASILWGVFLLVKKQWANAISLLASSIILSGVLFLVYRSVTRSLYPMVGKREVKGILSIFHQNPAGFLVATSGQVWYHLAASLGLVVIGVVFLVLKGRLEWKTRTFGAATWILIAALALEVVTAVYVGPAVTSSPFRLDTYTYGRYFQPMASLLSLFGILAALGGVRGKIRRTALLATMLAMAAYVVVGLRVLPDIIENKGGIWLAINVAGLTQFDWPNVTAAHSTPLVAATLAAAIGCFFLMRPRSAATVLVVLGGYFAVASNVAQVRTMRPVFGGFNNAFVLQNYVAQYPHDSVSFDTGGDEFGVSRNIYAYLLEPRPVKIIDTSKTKQLPTTDLVITRRDWPAGKAAGAELIASDSFQNNGLWLMPKAQK